MSRQFTSADPSVGDDVDDSGFGTWTIGTLAAGATETLVVYATAVSVTTPQGMGEQHGEHPVRCI
jgi:hypothetical protein